METSREDFVSGSVYAPSTEKVEQAKLAGNGQLFIDGRFCDGRGTPFASINPATGETLCTIAEASHGDVDNAVTAARRAFESTWGAMPGRERGKYLFRVARILQERLKEFAVLESLDGGKPIKESKNVDLPLAVQHFFYHAGWADKLAYACPAGSSGKPIGVVGQIIPWNFPLLMAAWKIAPALACGNCVVLKPAETTSLTALRLAQIFQEAELPAGVVNIVTGAGDTGRYLASHPGVDKVAFTGSTEVGKAIMAHAADAGKRYTLELGGKGANIIFEDAAIDQAVEGVIDSIYFNQGHVCCAGSRLFIQESVQTEVITKLKARMESIIVGNPLDKNTDMGAINSKSQLETIQNMCRLAEEHGAVKYETSQPLPETGFWHRPTFYEGVSQSDEIVQREVFGPVLAVQTFRTHEDLIPKANNTPYGLSAGIWSEKGSKNFALMNALEAGVVWMNGFNLFDACSPFGGMKESGIGREGGRHGLAAYLEGAQ